MFKRLIIISLSILTFASVKAQQNDLVYSGDAKGYIAMGMGFSKLDTLNSFYLNFKFGSYHNMQNGWLADFTIQVSEETQGIYDTLPYSFFAFQMGGGYSVIPFKKSGFVLSTSITGGIGFLMRTYQQEEEEEANTSFTKTYLYAEPTLTISYTVSENISIGISSAYRQTLSLGSSKIIDPQALNGLNYQAKLIFGF